APLRGAVGRRNGDRRRAAGGDPPRGASRQRRGGAHAAARARRRRRQERRLVLAPAPRRAGARRDGAVRGRQEGGAAGDRRARRSLWTAHGAAAMVDGAPDGTLSLRAERFSLDEVADILPASVLQPQDTSVDAAMDLTFSEKRVGFSGNLEVTGLNLHHEKL